jgi:hypothetical protein
MKTLAELPHRFWPERELPADVKVWPKFLNLKAAKFAKVYGKQVNPVLRKLGFKCKGMRGRGRVDDFVTLSWFAGGKAGGSGYQAFAAHPLSLPTRNNDMLGPDELDFQHCVFVREIQLFDSIHYGDCFDLGKDEDEAEQTCALLLEMIAEQAEPFLAGLPAALAELKAVVPAEFEARMPEMKCRLNLRAANGASRHTHFVSQRIELALLLGHLARLDGRDVDAKAWAAFGLELLAADEHLKGYPDPRHRFAILLEKLDAGSPELHFTASDRVEHERRIAAERAP